MVRKFCPDCKKEVDAIPHKYLWSACFGGYPVECPDCGDLIWPNNERVVDSATGDQIFHREGKYFSRNKSGEIRIIQIEKENT